MRETMFKKLIIIILSLFFIACSKKEDQNTIKVGTISGPETALMQVAAKQALQAYGLHVKIISFSDYTTPNIALNDGDIDANAFQHFPYLEAQIKERGYKIAVAAKTFLYPMAGYSRTITDIANLPMNAKVAIPNDPSNEGRALLLLQRFALIKLKPNVGFTATPSDIIDNPKHLKFIELDAAQLPRSMRDVSLAIINTNYAIPSGLSPAKDSIISENAQSPYTNIIVVREGEQSLKKVRELIKAYQSKPVLEKAKQLFGVDAIPG